MLLVFFSPISDWNPWRVLCAEHVPLLPLWLELEWSICGTHQRLCICLIHSNPRPPHREGFMFAATLSCNSLLQNHIKMFSVQMFLSTNWSFSYILTPPTWTRWDKLHLRWRHRTHKCRRRNKTNRGFEDSWATSASANKKQKRSTMFPSHSDAYSVEL